MTTISLGIAVQSTAGTAAADLDKLTVAADKAEKGAARVGRSSRDMSAALMPITALLTTIERHTGLMAAGMGQAATATSQMARTSGVATAELRSMDVVTAKVTMDMRGMQVGATSVTAAIAQEATAVRTATQAIRENTVAANENRVANVSRSTGSNSGGANNFNTANVAAQFQDIAVTSAMGMSPLQIALQQGTQLSAVLGGQGLTGVVRTLGAAFTSILSPVSLLTIGAVALGAAGLQALGGLFKGAESASDALERHNEWLDKVLAGYEGVRDAASDALDAATKLPQESVESTIGAKRATAANSAVAAMKEALDLKLKFEGELANAEFFSYAIPPETLSSLREMNELIQRTAADSSLSRSEIDELHVSLTQLGNNTSDTALKATANEALVLVDAARQAFAQVDSLDAALRNIPRDIQIRLQVSQEFSSSMGDLGDLYVDPRSRFEVAREQAKNLADQASATASSYGDLVGVGEEYQRVLSSIDKAEAEASAKTGARGAKSAAAAAAKPFNQWESATKNFQQRIDQQGLEISLLGQSTFEIERQRSAFELLNQAKDAGIPITATVTDQINTMSADFANSTVQLQQQQQAMSMLEGAAGSLANAFKDGKLELSEILDISINLLQQFLQMQQMGGAGGGGIGSFISSLFGGFGGGGGGGWGVQGGFSGFSGTFGIPGMATGGAVGRGGLSWVGEQGPELLSLPQGAQVIPNGPSMAMAANGNGSNDNRPNFSPTFQINGSGLSQAEMQRAIQDALDHYDRFQAPQTFNRVQNDPTARG